MLEEQLSDEDLMDLVYHFSDYRIKTKYLSLILDSTLILEALNLIYILMRDSKLTLDDMQQTKKFFQENFKFFSESEQYHEANSPSPNNQYGKMKLFLSILFFSLMIFSGVGCIYSPLVFIPLAIIFGLGLVMCTCLISLKNPPVEQRLDELHKKSCESELYTLKKNLNELTSSFAKKYQIIMTNVDNVYITLAEEPSEDFPRRKKSVTFAPTLNTYNLYNIESPESRSRTNSNENNGSLRPKG